MTPRSAALPLQNLTASEDRVLERRLASGRSLILRTDEAGEEIEIRSARGELDVKIVLTDAGPVVTLRGAKLEVESPDVAFRCRSFDVKTTGDLNLRSDRNVNIEADELRAKTEHDIHLNGAYVRINCDPDLQVPVQLPSAVVEALAAMAQPTADGCGAPPHSHHHDPQDPEHS